MAVTLSSSVLDRYRRFSRFNSPYPAHDDGCAIDLYPDSEAGISPVAGVVRETRTVGCPDRPYAADEDHLIVVELDEDWCRRAGAAPGTIARILHVVPEVSAGDRVAGDDSRPADAVRFLRSVGRQPRPPRIQSAGCERAPGESGRSRSMSTCRSSRYSGTGPAQSSSAARRTSSSTPPTPGSPVSGSRRSRATTGYLSTAGWRTTRAAARSTNSWTGRRCRCGAPASASPGRRRVAWDPIDVLANGERVVGLSSLFAARDDGFGAKIVCPDRRFDLGETVSLALAPSDDDPIRLGVG